MSKNLSLLQSRKQSLLNGISDARSRANMWGDKISRLQEASNSLQADITALEADKGEIDTYEINAKRWKGKEETRFSGTYAEYKEQVQLFVKKTKQAKETIDDEIVRCEANRASCLTSAENLSMSLSTVEGRIRQEMEKE
ncbi:protein of unknown function [Terribacillus halophilus]|uniref:Uncharacterized protein n=1 Tax=Terribacillus halophilus TaxID=361279 RepID=A0A1G6PXW2_9BACI|nr:DUF5082 family protein [Terribacillus halophilus]SDC84504.1 protein of unknown function [Terribacillus halophilus]